MQALRLAAPAAAFGVSARGLSPAKASVRSPAPQLVLGRVKSFVSNRIISPFEKGSEEERALGGFAFLPPSRIVDIAIRVTY